MKKKNILKLALLGTLTFSISYASNWEDVLRAVQGEKFNDDGTLQEGKLYNAFVRYKVINGNGNGNLDPNESVYLEVYDSKGNLVAKTPPEGYNEDGLKTWADERADTLLTAMFGGDPSQTVSGQSVAVNTAVDVSQTILALSEQAIETAKSNIEVGKEAVMKIAKGLEKKAEEKSKKAKLKELAVKSYSSQVMLDSEKGHVENYGFSGKTMGSRFSYAKNLTDEKSVGIILSYRSTDLDDKLNSESKSLSFVPYYKFNVNLNDKLDISYLFFLTASAVYLKSKMFPDGAGYLSYGAGVNIMPTYKFADNMSFSLSAGYQIDKKYIPESMVPDDLRFVATAVNNLKPLQMVTVSGNLKYYILPNWDVGITALYLKHLETSDLAEGRDKAVYYAVRSKYTFLKRFVFSVGYKLVDHVKSYNENSYMLSLSYNW